MRTTARERSNSKLLINESEKRSPARTTENKSLEYDLGIDCPLRIASMPPDTLIDKSLGIPRFHQIENVL